MPLCHFALVFIVFQIHELQMDQPSIQSINNIKFKIGLFQNINRLMKPMRIQQLQYKHDDGRQYNAICESTNV